MKLQWDFSELTDFTKKLVDKHNFDSTIMTATQKVARVLHQHLLEQTPIDTGNLRKMWSAGENLQFTVKPVQNGYEVTFINTARAKSADGFMYGLAVNDGHRTPNGTGWVMGRFFVEKSILQTEQQAEQIIMNELKKWWDSV
jgi:hypothetical protein